MRRSNGPRCRLHRARAERDRSADFLSETAPPGPKPGGPCFRIRSLRITGHEPFGRKPQGYSGLIGKCATAADIAAKGQPDIFTYLLMANRPDKLRLRGIRRNGTGVEIAEHKTRGEMPREPANIGLALAIIIVLFPLALFGVLGLAGVVLVHELAEVLVILNGIRAARRPARAMRSALLSSAAPTPATR